MIASAMGRLLDQFTVGTKCTESWDAMTGDGRVRFCGVCAKNVFNIAAMTQSEAERLLFETEGHVCTRLFRREDGRVLTRDCTAAERPRFLMKVAYATALAMPIAVAQQPALPGAMASQVDTA
jgi:hypothetical protein